MIEEYVIKTLTQSQFTLYGAIREFSDYKDLFRALKEAQYGDTLELRINSPGGDVSIGTMIVQAIKETQATVVCNVVYPSCSMAADIAVSGDYLVMQPHTFLMFHTYSCLDGGKSGDLLQSVAHNDLSIKMMMEEIVCPFLTKKELKKMHAGEDIYIRAEDTSLPLRVKRHFKDIIINE